MKPQEIEDELCILQSSNNFNKTSSIETRNNIAAQNQTHDSTVGIRKDLSCIGHKKINRAESVKNSKRNLKRKHILNQTRHPTTILSSYMPMKNYLSKDATQIKPVRQTIQERRTNIKSAVSQRCGSKTSKNQNRQNSKESFDQFVVRMNNQEQHFTTNQYAQRARPATSSGYGQLRIKHQKRPYTKSGISTKANADRNQHQYSQNKTFLPGQQRRKNSNKTGDYKTSNIFDDSKPLIRHRGTFCQSNKDSFVEKSSTSNKNYTSSKPGQVANTYFQNWYDQKFKYLGRRINRTTGRMT